MGAPRWMSKHPCTTCGEGYGFCAQWATRSRMCCTECNHPGRWVQHPYLDSEVIEMWEGKEMPEYVVRSLGGSDG